MIYPSQLKKEFYKTGEAAKFLQISPKTLYLWTRNGKINYIMSSTNRVQIPREELIRVLKERSLLAENPPLRDAIYARVDTGSQKRSGALELKTLQILEAAAGYHLNDPIIIKESGSGLECSRKGLSQLMEAARRRQIRRIFAGSTDDLAIIGYSYLEQYFKAFDVEIIPLFKEMANAAGTLEAMIKACAKKPGCLSRAQKEGLKKQIESFPEE